MITGKLKSQIDRLWEAFWTGGITNPLTVIEQISFLMFARLLDINESRSEKRWARRKKGADFPGEIFGPDQQHLRWSRLRQMGDATEQLRIVREELFPFLRGLGGKKSSFGRYLQDASSMIDKASLLNGAIEMIDALPLTNGDRKGDLYEYLLSKLTTAGINGQFRTPRHIIRHMLQMVKPAPDALVADPACGTAGFLVGTMEYLKERDTSEDGVLEETDDEGKTYKVYTGDLLEPWREHIQNTMFTGFDFDVTMLRIASMNLMLHDVPNPRIEYQDTLSRSFSEKHPTLVDGRFDVVLANPPFKGSIDDADTDRALSGVVKTRKTELLFLVRILQMLKLGGQAAVIVPDGVLFGSSGAHKTVRQMLVEQNQLDAVVSLPPGVFKPYAGVSTAILFFTKGGETREVFFYDVEADGYSLDDKRDELHGEGTNDLPDCLAQWELWAKGDRGPFEDKTQKSFAVSLDKISKADFDLSITRYREHIYEEEQYDPPKGIIARLREIEAEIQSNLDELDGMLE